MASRSKNLLETFFEAQESSDDGNEGLDAFSRRKKRCTTMVAERIAWNKWLKTTNYEKPCRDWNEDVASTFPCMV